MKTMKHILRSLPLALVAVLAGVAWGADAPIHYPFYDTPDADVGNYAGNYGFYYQLREVSGEKRSGYGLAGAQWFATTYENYLWHQVNKTTTTDEHRIYRRTMGGETPTVPLTTLADLLNSFDYVYINEPQPYQEWRNSYSYLISDTLFDGYMNPLESLCVVLPEGRGDLSVKFFNHYARHFPYWYILEATPSTIPEGEAGTSRDITADVQMAVDGYSIRVTPNTAQKVLPGKFMSADIRIQAESTGDYGSTVGYLSFRQSGSFDTGYSGWREAEHVPVVVANVSDGDASENPLYFDMIIFDAANVTSGDNVVNRVKFRWGAEEDLPNQSLGTFFLMQPYNNARSTPAYGLMTRVTNRTGTRYRLERYSTVNGTFSGDLAPINSTFEGIYPDYWAYDLTPDRYGSLPSRFTLDNHSQIAPGLVTVYWKNVGAGYQTINTNVGTSDSFRLYTFDGTTPHNLTLNYTRVAGMVAGEWDSILDRRVRVRPFTLANSLFVDRRADEDNTEAELEKLMGMPPALVTAGAMPSISLSAPYVNKSALDAFQITAPVPDGLATVSLAAESGDVTSPDVTSPDVTIKKAALLPVVVRFRVPRSEQILSTSDRWTALNNAENGEKVLTEFAKFGTIWVRSENTKMLDANLLKAIGDRGYDASKVVRAFTYNDKRDGEGLYLEFLAFLADAKSPVKGKTAFIELFKDDDIPYLLIGDGAADGSWDISFFIAETGANPEYVPSEVTSNDSGGGGGGCDTGMLGTVVTALLAGGAFLLRRRIC